MIMNSEVTSYKLITDPEEWFSLLHNDLIIIKSFRIVSEDCIEVYYSQKYPKELVDISLIHGAFITAYGRLRLYSEMEKLGARLFYTDTDCTFFIHSGSHYFPQVGSNLGDLVNELEEGEWIVEWVSLGPKNYSFLTNFNRQVITVKGFRMDQNVKKKINFESMKNLILNYRTEKIEVDQLKFSRNKDQWDVYTNIITKKYGFCYTKRVIQKDYSTLPYGY
jgi:hypothetical protein